MLKKIFFPGSIYILTEIFNSIKTLEFKNAFLLFRFRFLRTLYLSSNIPRSNSIKYKFKESIELKDKGYVIFPSLDSSVVESLINQYKSTCKRCYGKEYEKLINDLYKNNRVRGAFCNLLPTEEIIEIIKNVLPIVKDTLRINREKIRIYTSCDTLVSPINESDYKQSINSSYDDALRFHRDFDGLRFLKYFILLTDCDKETGAHFIVESSATKGHLDLIGHKRFDMRKILRYFNEDKIQRIEGQRGFNFLEDTNNFHSGSIPKKGRRILLQFLFLDYTSARYKSFSEPYICLNLLDGGVYNQTGGKNSIFNT